MNNKEMNGFLDKIEEAIIKCQKTLPKQLPEKEIRSISALIREFVTYNLQRGGGMHIDLSELIDWAISNGKKEHVGQDGFKPEEINEHIDKTKDIINSSELLSSASKEEIDENIPYLGVLISHSYLGLANHANQYVYSSDGTYKVTKDYFVKPHAQVVREYEEKQRRKNDIER